MRASDPMPCVLCPHFDTFEHTCTHPERQTLRKQLANNTDNCSVFTTLKAEAMQELAADLEPTH